VSAKGQERLVASLMQQAFLPFVITSTVLAHDTVRYKHLNTFSWLAQLSSVVMRGHDHISRTRARSGQYLCARKIRFCRRRGRRDR
jgi:hypothetical protein